MTTSPGGDLSTGWRCALIGGEPLLIQCATMLIDHGHEVAVIITRRPAIRDWAEAQGIAVRDDVAALLTPDIGSIDYLFSITNLTILPPAVLRVPSRAAINFHDGPMPDMAGLNTPIWSLLTGRKTHGVTWHLMEELIDTGAILASQSFALDAHESAHSINTKCFAAGVESFGQLLDLLKNEPAPIAAGSMPQQYFGREHRPTAAATINWNRSAEEVAALVRHLDFAGHANPLNVPKFRVDKEIVLVCAATVETATLDPVFSLPGTIVRADANGIGVATGDGHVLLTRFATTNGTPLTSTEAILRYTLTVGSVLECETEERIKTLSALDAAVAYYEPWWRARLAASDPLILPLNMPANMTAPGGAGADIGALELQFDGTVPATTIVASLIAYLARITDREHFNLGYSDPIFAARAEGVEPWFASSLPLSAMVDFERGLDQCVATLAAEIRTLHRRVGYAADLIARSPELLGRGSLPVQILITDRVEDVSTEKGLVVAIATDGTVLRWCHGADVDAASLGLLTADFPILFKAALAEPTAPIGTLPLMTQADLATLVAQGSGVDMAAPGDLCLHEMFAQAARRTPDAPAVTSRGVTLSYAELDGRANRLANHLRALGVGPEVLVGLHLDRSVDLAVSLLAIHKAGGAYVPLDPSYPRDRIAHMVQDAGLHAIVTQERVAGWLPETNAALVLIDTDGVRIARASANCPDSGVSPANLAYIIYTSGSTGLPKGVMVEHCTVANFFVGMDTVCTPGGTWLAVTSLSFDISVLELYWTLARGCHVVIATGDELKGQVATAGGGRAMAFSLFYFASADGGAASDQYRLLLDGARFADTHDFAAVWTPERHFHPFGGLYPNPAVTSAAIAAVTKRIAIRGGSVVLPLHHPVRVAEEWSLVDNLSGGRVGVAFAAGWQPNDFVLRPENYADKTRALSDGIETVRALWRGETRSFPGPLGTPVDVTVYPRPVQHELPFWITTAGNPESFAAAGRAGANLLTHLLGQTVQELSEKIAIYRRARREAGHQGDGHVTLMLHSFVGNDEDEVRAVVRQPLIDYLRTSTNLVKEFAWSFPAFKNREGTANLDLGALNEEEMSGLLDHAFERYFDNGGLFGTPERCCRMVDAVRAAGVAEIGCLIDFGIPAQTVLDHLPMLNELRRRSEASAAAPDETIGAVMKRHRVTHLQCTPSMAQMLASDDEAREGLAALQQMMVGGEAFPLALATELNALVGGSVHNMYGPTETTIWSSTHLLGTESGAVPLGSALANQQLHVLDSRGQPLPWEVPGELVIGGAGVVRGYLNRPALTAERFVAHPFDPLSRAYRTGDLVRRRRSGKLEFLGRRDHQVKVRGHRIELGEIEAALADYHGVQRTIVTAREDVVGEALLIGYYVVKRGVTVDGTMLRDHLSARLPGFMVPTHLIALPALPRLPNGKTDRAALPGPDVLAAHSTGADFVAPKEGFEQIIAGIWREVLKLPDVGTRDNFFDIGGHSLLAVQVHRQLRAALGRSLPLTDIFRFPTIRALAAHLSANAAGDSASPLAPTRAAARRAAMHRRQNVAYSPVDAGA